MNRISVITGICLLLTPAASAQFRGSASLQPVIDLDDSENSSLRVRCLPEFYRLLGPGFSTSISAELDVSGSSSDEMSDSADADLYRCWIRYARMNWEIRGGLQKINFGPAKILRSLMWFEAADVRDPLKEAGGVRGLLFRYYFLDNSNIWLWGLWGEEKLKGLETFVTKKETLESGGRIQVPLPGGEGALSFHNRALSGNANRKLSPGISGDGYENRFGMDASFDIGPGIFFEITESRIDFPGTSAEWRNMLTAGIDYTLPVGPGILVSSEYFTAAGGEDISAFTGIRRAAAFSADMSISVLDSVRYYGLYYQNEEKFSSFIMLSRLYDNVGIDAGLSLGEAAAGDVYSGNRVILTVTYSY